MKKILKGLVFGAVTGVVSGLLFAPRSGKKTREKITEEANDWKKLQFDFSNDQVNVQNATKQLKIVAEEHADFIDETKKELNAFKFQTEPRISQIKEQVRKIQKNLKNTDEK